MQISILLRNRALAFDHAADAVCKEYTQAIAASGICSPCDRQIFNQMIIAKLNQSQVIPIASERLSA